jgi:hypothetical protein
VLVQSEHFTSGKDAVRASKINFQAPGQIVEKIVDYFWIEGASIAFSSFANGHIFW